MSLKTIVTSFADFILFEEKIVIVKFTFDGELTLEQGMEIFKLTMDLSQGKRHAIIYDFNNCNIIFSQEIKLGAQKRSLADDILISRAFVAYNLSNKLEVNHFIKFNKPSIPNQLFNSFEEALKWTKLQLA